MVKGDGKQQYNCKARKFSFTAKAGLPRFPFDKVCKSFDNDNDTDELRMLYGKKAISSKRFINVTDILPKQLLTSLYSYIEGDQKVYLPPKRDILYLLKPHKQYKAMRESYQKNKSLVKVAKELDIDLRIVKQQLTLHGGYNGWYKKS